MATDFGSSNDPEAVKRFWRAAFGKRARRPRRTAQQLRPDIPRAGRAGAGEGGREKDLATLARAGYTVTHQQHGQHWLSNPTSGTSTPRQDSYRAAIDAALEHIVQGAD